MSTFRDVLAASNVLVDLESRERRGALRELLDHMSVAGLVKSRDCPALLESLLDREKKGSTGFGKGQAHPHAYVPCITRQMVAIGRSRPGINYGSLDRAPVFVMMLRLSPIVDTGEALALAEGMFRYCSMEPYRELVRQAASLEDILNAMDRYEATGAW